MHLVHKLRQIKYNYIKYYCVILCLHCYVLCDVQKNLSLEKIRVDKKISYYLFNEKYNKCGKVLIHKN